MAETTNPDEGVSQAETTTPEERVSEAETTNPEERVTEGKTNAELKRELLRVLQSIVEEDDHALEDTDCAMQTLFSLKELLIQLSPESVLNILPPPELRCPISGQLMKDPVVVASGQTYDRPFIQQWFRDGNQTCPLSNQVLSHTILTPNLLLKKIIARWYNKHGIELPSTLQDVDGDMIIANATDKERLSFLLEKLSSSSLSDKKMASKEIRQLTKQSASFRSIFGEVTDAISKLIEPLSLGADDVDPGLQEDLITATYNFSVHDSNRKLMAENSAVIPLIIKALQFGTIETRSNAAAALFSLSALDCNKNIIGNFGALKPLIELMDQGNLQAMADAASAIFSLCIDRENKSRAVADGAVGVIMNKIRDRLLMDELLSTLVLLSSHYKAVEEMAKLDAVSLLLDIIREYEGDRNKENCITILHAICSYDRRNLREIKKEEDANGTISQLANSGTSRAKRKANGILERLNRYYGDKASTS